MKSTSERHSPAAGRSPEERAIDARHRYAYSLVREYAQPTDHLLDVGSGEGYGSTIVRGWVADYAGVDVSADAVEHARAHYGGPGVRFECSDGATLPFADRHFDLITSFQVIEHVGDVSRYVRELHRVAKPDAVVLLTTPNRVNRLREGERPWNRYHLREYSAHQLAALLGEAFSRVELYGVRGPAAMESLELKRIARARLFARLDPAGLRYRLPESVDRRIRGLLRATPWRPPSQSSFGVDDLRHTADDLDASLDLLAVARP